MKKLSVAILFGGRSVEHRISINSAKNIFTHIDRTKFVPMLIGISPAGSWHLMSEVADNFSDHPPLALSLSVTQKGLINIKDNSLITPDVFFLIVHGTDGEDGGIQGLLRTVDIPFTGTGVLGSAVAMSKLYTKKLLREAGIPTSKFLSYTYSQRQSVSFAEVSAELGLPFMVKAANLGSSVGISKVAGPDDFKKAIDEAFRFDEVLLFEEYIRGRELECAVMGDREVKASMPAEIIIDKNYDFYTYEAKYNDPNAVKLKIPAEISEENSREIRELSVKAYQTLGCEGFARVDIFMKENGEIFVNEINTLPGFTDSSMFPMMWQERGITFTDLISKLIEMAMTKYETSKRPEQHYRD